MIIWSKSFSLKWMGMCVCMWTYMCVFIPEKHVYMYIHVCANIYAHINIYIFMCIPCINLQCSILARTAWHQCVPVVFELHPYLPSPRLVFPAILFSLPSTSCSASALLPWGNCKAQEIAMTCWRRDDVGHSLSAVLRACIYHHAGLNASLLLLREALRRKARHLVPANSKLIATNSSL